MSAVIALEPTPRPSTRDPIIKRTRCQKSLARLRRRARSLGTWVDRNGHTYVHSSWTGSRYAVEATRDHRILWSGAACCAWCARAQAILSLMTDNR